MQHGLNMWLSGPGGGGGGQLDPVPLRPTPQLSVNCLSDGQGGLGAGGRGSGVGGRPRGGRGGPGRTYVLKMISATRRSL